MKVIVVGAGLSGLAAANRLQQAGVDVEVLEATAQPGGRCAFFQRDGFLVDCGPEIVASSYERYLALARGAGLGADIVDCSPIMAAVQDGRVLEIDTSRLSSMLFTPILSLRAKLTLAVGYWRHRHLIASADAYRLADIANKDDDKSNAENYAVSLFGREVAETLIDPLMRLLGGASMRFVSTLCVLGGVKSWASALLTIRGGYRRVAIALAAQLPVRFNTMVSRVTEGANGVTVTATDNSGSAVDHTADFCILTTMFDDSVRIFHRIGQLSPESFPYAPLNDIKLAYSAPTTSRAFVVQIPTRENTDLLLLTLTHNKSPDRAPPGHSLFTLYTDANAWDRFAAKSDQDAIDWARAQVEPLYPEVKGHFLFGHVHRQARAGYLAVPGFYRRVAKLFDDLAGSRVQLAGDLFAGGSMEAAVVWGERAAERLLARTSTPSMTPLNRSEPS